MRSRAAINRCLPVRRRPRRTLACGHCIPRFNENSNRLPRFSPLPTDARPCCDGLSTCPACGTRFHVTPSERIKHAVLDARVDTDTLGGRTTVSDKVCHCRIYDSRRAERIGPGVHRILAAQQNCLLRTRRHTRISLVRGAAIFAPRVVETNARPPADGLACKTRRCRSTRHRISRARRARGRARRLVACRTGLLASLGDSRSARGVLACGAGLLASLEVFSLPPVARGILASLDETGILARPSARSKSLCLRRWYSRSLRSLGGMLAPLADSRRRRFAPRLGLTPCSPSPSTSTANPSSTRPKTRAAPHPP